MSAPDADRILATLKEFLAERFDVPDASAVPEARLADLGLDSMMVMDIMLEVEDRLGVKLDDLSIPKAATLADVVEMVQRNLRQPGTL